MDIAKGIERGVKFLVKAMFILMGVNVCRTTCNVHVQQLPTHLPSLSGSTQELLHFL